MHQNAPIHHLEIMHLLGLTSRYALLGLLLTVLTALILSGPPSPEPAVTTIVKMEKSPAWPTPQFDVDPSTLAEHKIEANTGVNTDEKFSHLPSTTRAMTIENSCFDVSYAPELLAEAKGGKALFTGQPVAAREVMLEDIEAFLLDRLHYEITRGTEECIEGSVIISLQIDGAGTIGPTMLAHHLRGGTDYAGLAIMAYFSDLRHDGRRWQNSTGEPMEVRLPLKFKLLQK